jgi:D-amino-acid dehydrogenase
MVGLSVAWHLQQHDVQVNVIDRGDVGMGASWGNAGWISPDFATPLPEPSVLSHGFKSLIDSRSPIYVPPRIDLDLWRFLVRFATFCTQRQWDKAMRSYGPINRLALPAYDELADSGVQCSTHSQSILAVFEDAEEARPLQHEIEQLARVGQPIRFQEFSGMKARQLEPTISSEANYVVAIEGQRYLDPGAFVQALASAVRERGGTIVTGVTVTSLSDASGDIVAHTDGEDFRSDAAVIATGAWLKQLGSRVGVRTQVRAGRGYSFSVPTEQTVTGPIYLPAKRTVCTPYQGGLRIAGTMEFQSASAPIDQRRVDNLIRASQPMLTGVDWNNITDVWVGPRPVSCDGMPLIGATNSADVFVAGGHGMWGITLGPITGKLLAELVATGRRSPVLDPFDPLR